MTIHGEFQWDLRMVLEASSSPFSLVEDIVIKNNSTIVTRDLPNWVVRQADDCVGLGNWLRISAFLPTALTSSMGPTIPPTELSCKQMEGITTVWAFCSLRAVCSTW